MSHVSEVSDVAHQIAHHGASSCSEFKDSVKVVRVLRIENWHLWAKYRSHVHQMKQDILKYGLAIAKVEPPLPETLLVSLPNVDVDLDAAVGECFLFHGTAHETAVKIAHEGFDFRLSKPGYYGHGTYFGSQACKSHQYTQPINGLRTMVLSRVAVGDV